MLSLLSLNAITEAWSAEASALLATPDLACSFRFQSGCHTLFCWTSSWPPVFTVSPKESRTAFNAVYLYSTTNHYEQEAGGPSPENGFCTTTGRNGTKTHGMSKSPLLQQKEIQNQQFLRLNYERRHWCWSKPENNRAPITGGFLPSYRWAACWPPMTETASGRSLCSGVVVMSDLGRKKRGHISHDSYRQGLLEPACSATRGWHVAGSCLQVNGQNEVAVMDGKMSYSCSIR